MAQESLTSAEETVCPPPEGPMLCAQNCGFFGIAETLNLCSQCYKIHMSKHAEAATTASSASSTAGEKGVSAKSASEGDHSDESFKQKSEPTSALATPLVCEGSSAATAGKVQGGGSSSTATEAASEEPGKRNSHQAPKRCMSCKKRLGLTGFECKCGNFYCSVHRYSDEHNCTFDYKSSGREAIAQANPVVKAEKIEKV